jgi:threonine/homoserine/homoserine lactone efflux protein
MSLIALISLSVAMLILAASPGPGVFATVARSFVSGFRPAFALIIGIVIGDIIYLMFAIFGLSIIAQTLGGFFIIVKLCGGAYLFCLGLIIWFSKPSVAESEALHKNQSRSGNIICGLLITLSNPKVILFYCGFLPTFIDINKLIGSEIALIACIVTFVLGSVLITYAYFASHARQLFSSQKVIKRLNRSAGVVMMATGVAIAAKS